MEIKEEIVKALAGVTGLPNEQIHLETPENEGFGDYSSNVAMVTFENAKLQIPNAKWQNSREYAEVITGKLRQDKDLQKIVEKIEIAGPGFINFWLKTDVLLSNLIQIDKEKEVYGKNDIYKNRKIVLEHTSPNPQTTIMLGHLRNNFLGMSIANLLEFSGAKVTKDAIVNDRGMHVCRSIWGYLHFASKESGLTKDELVNFKGVPEESIEKISSKAKWRELLNLWVKDKTRWFTPHDLNLKLDHANLVWYVLGSKAFKKFDNVENQVKEILGAWEAEDSQVWQIWKTILDWSAKGYEETYKRIGSVHDWVWYESALYKGGKEFVEKGLEKAIFKKSEGAVVTNLADYGLADTVVIKSDGTSTYMVFDLNLTDQKIKKFPSDLYIWTIGVEQSHYFRQLFAVCEQLGMGKRDRFYHLSYALINFKGGKKMATREGAIVMADEILDTLEENALEIVKSSNQELRAKLTEGETTELVKMIALAAIKYSLLKVGRETTIFYDMNESISLEGNSGPYLQYTVARTNSVLAKLETNNLPAGRQGLKLTDLKSFVLGLELNAEELALLRSFVRFSDTIVMSAKNYSPNILCGYLYDLAQKFNAFYNKHWILPRVDGKTKSLEYEDPKSMLIRPFLTAATGQILKNGLRLLGIQTPERM